MMRQNLNYSILVKFLPQMIMLASRSVRMLEQLPMLVIWMQMLGMMSL